MDTGDTAWMLTSTALVLFMTPGLAFFYGGMVRSKNVLGMLMYNFFAIGLVAVIWSVVGYSLAFGDDTGAGLIGNLDHVGLQGTGGGEGIPTILFVAFQMTFAVITPALISGAVADRMKFSAWAIFIGIWSIVVYSPVAHWVWSSAGWIFEMEALDFAGGTVVHINAGAAALAVILVLGKRAGWPKEPMPPHNLPFTLLGTGILLFGWIGFNAGSALAANELAALALMNTFLAGSAGMLGWLIVERIKDGHATTLGAASGVVAGLVAITPCAGFVSGLSPIAIGAIAGGLCFLAIQAKYKLGYDDSLDVIGVHLVGGVIGSVILGLFATTAANDAGRDGVFFGGGTALLLDQLVATVATLGFSFIVSFVIAKALDLTIGIRVDADAESVGLDTSQHAETAYATAGRIG